MGAPRPLLASCFDSQPHSLVDTCYTLLPGSGGGATIGCRWPAAHGGSGAGNTSESVLQCRDGNWEYTDKSGRFSRLSCRAPPRSAWRVTAQDSTSQGWWLHELGFFADSRCHVPVHGVSGTFAFGPHGAVEEAPPELFDGDGASIWRAPCSRDEALDLCGCHIGKEEWSHEDQACVPGRTTDENTQKQCAENSDGAERPPSGCIAGHMTVGVQLESAQDVSCVRMLQSDAASLSVTAIALEVWDDSGWRQVRQWTGVAGGAWQTLALKSGCSAYALPRTAPRWAEVVDEPVSAAHGEVRTIRCIVNPVSVQVRCSNGVWGKLPPFMCSPPELPGLQERPVDALRQRVDWTPGPVQLLLLGFAGAFACVLLLLGGAHAASRLLRRQAWKRLAREGATPPPTGPARSHYRRAVAQGDVDLKQSLKALGVANRRGWPGGAVIGAPSMPMPVPKPGR